MRELRYGEQIQDYTCNAEYQIKWTFPENIHINKLYEEIKIINKMEMDILKSIKL